MALSALAHKAKMIPMAWKICKVLQVLQRPLREELHV